jgi:hypothetical protein
MRTLLLNNQTGFYLQGIQRWTKDPDQAFDFKLVERALKFIEIWRLENVELAFSFSDSHVSAEQLDRNVGHSGNQSLTSSSV